MIAADLIRALRGRRSRAAFSKRLGYRSNAVQRWEAGQAWPTADDFLTRLARIEPRTAGVLSRFHGRDTVMRASDRVVTPQRVAAFLRALRGKTPIATLVQRTGYSRYRISRWLAGNARPRLPELLCVVEAASQRLLDLLSGLTDPARMPTVAPRWRELCAAREAAYESPWSQAVLHALELRDYREHPSSRWLAARLGSTAEDVEAALSQLLRAGQIRRVRGRYRVREARLVDTGADPTRARRLKAQWTRTAAERLEAGAPGSFGYTLFAVSRGDLQRLRDLHLEYVRAMQTIIAESEKPDCVGLYCAQLLDLAVRDNALAH
jgi:transcriptional regulator with XRE-family HTH domain